MQRRKLTCGLLLAASISLVISNTKSRADVELPAVISEHMVLQRDMPASVKVASSLAASSNRASTPFWNCRPSSITSPVAASGQ